MSGSAMAAIQTMRQNRAIRAFRSAGAMSPQSARSLADLNIPEGSAVRRLITNGVLVPAPHDPARYYLDERALRRLNVRRLFACLVVMLVALLAVWWVRSL
jgi:hypothetical protein